MADQPGDRCTASLGLDYGRQLGAASLLSKRGKGGAGVRQWIDRDCDTLCLDLDSRPSQPPDLHLGLLLSDDRTVSSFACPAAPRQPWPRLEPPSRRPRSIVPRSKASRASPSAPW